MSAKCYNSLKTNFSNTYFLWDSIYSCRLLNDFFISGKLWKSFFNYNKPVRHHGSEAVNNYFSPFYPPTPSAAGSVISKQLVKYLTNDMNYMMHGFETIANSLAVWLAPIGPTYYDEPDWFSTVESAYNATEGKFLLSWHKGHPR